MLIQVVAKFNETTVTITITKYCNNKLPSTVWKYGLAIRRVLCYVQLSVSTTPDHTYTPN